jgi:hypothetical protein
VTRQRPAHRLSALVVGFLEGLPNLLALAFNVAVVVFYEADGEGESVVSAAVQLQLVGLRVGVVDVICICAQRRSDARWAMDVVCADS